ncbi:MAG TPA: M20 aminoacylase family protein [Methylomirabilota bacterium]|jgi:hippurate hydrolase|nr:M20 aminoacylase family protein [Methylomirabilota bacterium]
MFDETFHRELTAWRRDIHQHPETAYEEHRTSDMVAGRLQSFGLQVHRGLAETGVVGTLKLGASPRAIGLRADMDALPMQELNQFEHRSVNAGKMHACGHDGHVTMLLGAARLLAAEGGFDGTVHVIFQPAEEGGAGGRRMVQEGLFERFPVEAVYGLHNLPGIPAGQFATRPGPVMAAADEVEILVRGTGGHAAMPHRAADPILAAAHVVTGLQSIVSRNTDPMENAVVSMTMFHGGEAHNVIPDRAKLTGSVRTFKPEVQDRVIAAIGRIARHTAEAFGSVAEVDYRRGYPPTVNAPKETEFACSVAAKVAAKVDPNTPPIMGAEDFSFMLQAKPGCFMFIGNGDGSVGGCMVHNPNYDFNDAILPTGVRYWVELVRAALPS